MIHVDTLITTGWRHVLLYNKRQETLHAMSRLIRDYDIVALKKLTAEAYARPLLIKSLLLAQYADFPVWYQQCTRNMGRLAQHSNGLLSKVKLDSIYDHKLPGVIPGRGARSHWRPTLSTIIVAHLALSRRVRKEQMAS